MPVEFHSPLNDAQLSELEQALNVKLPPTYRAFLKKYDGVFVSTPDYVSLPLNKVDDGEIAFTALFSFASKNDNFNLLRMNDELRHELDFLDSPLVIGDDGGDNFFVTARKRGSDNVLYWDRTHLHAEDSKKQFDVKEVNECGNLYILAADFAEFERNLFQQHLEKMQFVEVSD